MKVTVKTLTLPSVPRPTSQRRHHDLTIGTIKEGKIRKLFIDHTFAEVAVEGQLKLYTLANTNTNTNHNTNPNPNLMSTKPNPNPNPSLTLTLCAIVDVAPTAPNTI